MQKAGRFCNIHLERCERSKSELYIDLLPEWRVVCLKLVVVAMRVVNIG